MAPGCKYVEPRQQRVLGAQQSMHSSTSPHGAAIAPTPRADYGVLVKEVTTLAWKQLTTASAAAGNLALSTFVDFSHPEALVHERAGRGVLQVDLLAGLQIFLDGERGERGLVKA